MRCPGCAKENPQENAFCGACGAALERVCDACGRGSPPGQAFCGGCGESLGTAGNAAPEEPAPRSYTPGHLVERILRHRSALQGERKQVTVLFADVVGSMDLAGRLDPEDWHRVLDRFFERVAEAIHHFDGTINQFTGDGIMALFGAPLALEDHAERACYAALHLQRACNELAAELLREHGVAFGVRVGINSGEVIVGRIGDDLRMDYTAQGHSVGLASRVEQMAASGSVLLAGDTAALITDHFELEAKGAFQLKGVQNPVEIHRLVRPRPRRDAMAERALTPLVGREPELALLLEALERIDRYGGQVVTIVGEAGVGKSRLCFEFGRLCRARGGAVHRSGGRSHERMLPLEPVLQLARDLLGGGQVTTSALEAELRHLDLGEEASLLLEFLGLTEPTAAHAELSGDARERRLFRVIRRLIAARAAQAPLVLQIEDLQWVDEASVRFLDELIARLPGSRVLLVVNYRPGFLAAFLHQPHCRVVHLRPLDPGGTGLLVAALVGAGAAATELTSEIHRRTDGNPLFTEELVHSLADSGHLEGRAGSYRLVRPVGDIRVPRTIEALIAARIDSLDEREKHMLQLASVIGTHFEEAVLAEVTAEPVMELAPLLATLVRSDFLEEREAYPRVEYSFRHRLVQEVAYRSQLRDQRHEIHAGTARALEELEPEKIDERSAQIAHHWEQSGALREALGFYRRAAHWTGRNHPRESLAHFEAVRRLGLALTPDPELLAWGLEARSQILMLGSRVGIKSEDVTVLLREGRELAAASGNEALLVTLLLLAWYALSSTGHSVEARATADEALTLADASGDPRLRGQARLAVAQGFVGTGSMQDGLDLADEIEEISRQGGQSGVTDHRLDMVRGNFLARLGRGPEARKCLEAAIAHAQSADELQWVQIASCQAATYCWMIGEGDAALEHGRRATHIAEQTGTPGDLAMAYRSLGQGRLARGEWEQARVSLERGLDVARRAGTLIHEEMLLENLAQAHLGLGDGASAVACAEGSVEIAAKRTNDNLELQGLITLTRCWLERDGPEGDERISAALERAEALIRESCSWIYLPDVHQVRANLARAQGDGGRFEAELREAHRLLVEIGAPIRARKIEETLQ